MGRVPREGRFPPPWPNTFACYLRVPRGGGPKGGGAMLFPLGLTHFYLSVLGDYNHLMQVGKYLLALG